jgi:hypothetical protein
LGCTVAIWGIYLLFAILRGKITYKEKRERNARVSSVSDDTETSEASILLRHANFRISAYIKSAFPEVTWAWVSREPEQIVAEGGTGRIKLFGISEFNYADVSFDRYANLTCNLLRVVPVEDFDTNTDFTDTEYLSAEPAIWYDTHGKSVLESIISDLNSRGHSELLIKETGDICVGPIDADAEQGAFDDFPAKRHWNTLAKVMSTDGYHTRVTDSGIRIAW